MRALWAEFIGTFLLVFAGTGAIIVNSASAGAVTQVGIALAFGLAVAIGICGLAEFSGAHFNPAVTIGLAIAGRFAWARVPAYIVAECAGAVSASRLLRVLFPRDVTLGATLPFAGVGIAFGFEVVMTFFLVFTIVSVARAESPFTGLAPLAIGGAVALNALFGGPISGASMNPARSLGPALVTGNWTAQWIYWTAPIAGAVIAAACFSLLRVPAKNEVP